MPNRRLQLKCLLMDNKEVRKLNIAWLSERHGGPTAFAALVGRSQVQVSQWVGGTPVGDKLARHIEAKMERKRGWLDSPQWLAETEAHDEQESSLAFRITQARVAAGLSQSELARRCEITIQSLSDLERGKSKTTKLTTLISLSKVLGYSPEWFALGEGLNSLGKNVPETRFEIEFLNDFRKLTEGEKKIVVRMVRSLTIDK